MSLRRIVHVSLIVILFFSCTKDSGTTDSSPAGTGGSLARFTIAANHLYLVDYSNLKVFDLANPSKPVEQPDVYIGFNIETIFPYKDKLFIGSRNGMFIYSIADPSNPLKLGTAQHVRSCDPVIANDSVSYSTLKGNSSCGPVESGLYIYDIKNISSPVLKKILPLGSPSGLGLKDSVVFICRENEGLTAVNVKDPADPKIMYTVTDGNYHDVIPYDNLLICYVSAGILIYDISNLKQIQKIGVVNY